jgi:1-acyl-sn-glycerol-3-phosphate acyltransferase
VYAVNHSSALDIPVLYASLSFQFRIIFKKELLGYPFVGWHLKRSGQICIDQQNPAASISTMRSGLKALKSGLPLVIFPEGGRTPDGNLASFMPGAFFLAIKAGVPVVPVALVGMYELLPMNTYHIQSRRLEMRVGEPIPTTGYTLRTMDQLAARVQAQVEHMRGSAAS